MVVTLMQTGLSCLEDFWLSESGAWEHSLSITVLDCAPETRMPTWQVVRLCLGIMHAFIQR